MTKRTYYVSDLNSRPWRVTTRRPPEADLTVRAANVEQARASLDEAERRRRAGSPWPADVQRANAIR